LQSSIIYDPVELLRRYDPEDKLERYYQLLLQENKRINLVSRETTEGGFISLTKLAAQSLLPFEKIDIDEIENYLDIGSGGGFPAVPILLTEKVKQATLIERTKKKAGALRRILLALDVKAEIINQSFEETSLELTFDLITLQLVKLTPQLFESIFSVLKPGGYFVYYATPDFDPTDKSTESATFYYSTALGEASGRFTIFHKKFNHKTF
jgi:16S rRNA (guanine527-N7)-methyltransferase